MTRELVTTALMILILSIWSGPRLSPAVLFAGF